MNTNLMFFVVGPAELIVIFVILVVLTAMVGLAIAAVVLLTRLWRQGKHPSERPPPVVTAKLGTCPRCGNLLSPDAAQGLCPRCVLQVGLGTQDDLGPAFRDSSGRPNPPAPSDLAVHFPQLEILELLGQGGMGAVYKARQKDLDRLVALKILPGGPERDPAFAERFTREARALARLSHPHIVSVHDFGQVPPAPSISKAIPPPDHPAPAEFYYFIMEYIDGPNLREFMRGQQLSPGEAMSIVPRICEALQFAHDEGVVHRDIKPENILIDQKGGVKIADFGIAKIGGENREATLTGAHDVMGTPHYMAPEQIERPLDVDHRADIYSLGVVFYEMLTGELPLGKFDLPSHRVQMDVRLDAVVLRSLAKAPERRYQAAGDVKTDVENIAGHPGEISVPPAPLPLAPNPDTRFSRLAILGALWAPLIVCCTLMYSAPVVVPDGQQPPGPAWWQMALAFILLPLGLAAPFGTTLCGLVSLSIIRRSRGRVYGLGLALFDALLFPLLILNALIVWIVFQFMKLNLVWVGFDPGTEPALDAVLLPAVLIVLVVNAWLIRWAWRAAPGPAVPRQPAPARPWAVIASILLLLGALALMVASSFQSRNRVRDLDRELNTRLVELQMNSTETERQALARRSLHNVPPVVVRTIPESGASQVDPDLTHIRVTFSKPMQDGSWSWGKLDDATWPERAGSPHFENDGRTCVLPVNLEPGTVYAIWINVDNLQNFRDQDGNPAVPYLLVMQTKE